MKSKTTTGISTHPKTKPPARHRPRTARTIKPKGVTAIISTPEAPVVAETVSFHPKTELGRRLWELRLKNIAAGEPLLTPEELEHEIAQRRGGVEWTE